MHRINFEDFCVKPIKVGEGSTFHIGTKRPQGVGDFGYVENSYSDQYHNIEG